MFRHQKYLEIPWEIHWRHTETEPQHHQWWPVALLLLAIFLVIGVGASNGMNN